MKKHIVIGDIHSNHRALDKLVNKYNPLDYHYIFLGDYSDYRGENPREKSNYITTIKTVMYLVAGYDAIALLGNHDDKLIRYLNGNKVEIKEGMDNTIYDINNSILEFAEDIYNFLKRLPLTAEVEVNGIKYSFAHAYYTKDQEIFARVTTSTPKEWKWFREHSIYGVPREDDQRVFWWEREKYLSRIEENQFKIAGHYHLVLEGDKFLILDATPNIACYIIEDKQLDILSA